MKYSEISDKWFRLLLPKGVSYEAYERELGREDRDLTKKLVEQMAHEAPKTAETLFGIKKLPKSKVGVAVLDDVLTPDVVSDWAAVSNPRDPENELKLNLSEFAVHLGESLISELGGDWFYARSPNYFQSTVRVGSLEFLPFDAVMKKVSDDLGNEPLQDKFDRFTSAVLRTN
jgi:hypothetical protein